MSEAVGKLDERVRTLEMQVARHERAVNILTGDGDTEKSLISRVQRHDAILRVIMWAVGIVGTLAVTGAARLLWLAMLAAQKGTP